jgi:cytoskeleton protein RodZ
MLERNRIAEVLRSAREKQGLSLEQAAASAGIPVQYLRLLEGEANVRIGVSDELYLIPFFRKYARFFDIDAEEMLPEFLGVVQQIPGEGSPPLRLAYRPRWGFLWKPAAALVTIGIAVLLMLRQAPQRPAFEESVASGEKEQSERLDAHVTAAAPVTSPLVRAAEATPVAGVGVIATSSPAETVSTSSPAPVVTPSAVPTGAHELKITAVEEAWLSLAVDEQAAKQYLLRAGETRTWSAGTFSLTVGNAGGVAVAIDGRDLPPIGRPGKVVRNLRLPDTAPSSSPIAQ